jgi:hypothetical protein
VLRDALERKLGSYVVKEGRKQIVKEVSGGIKHAIHSHAAIATQGHINAAAHSIVAHTAAVAATPIAHAILSSGVVHSIGGNVVITISHKTSFVVGKLLSSVAIKKLATVARRSLVQLA